MHKTMYCFELILLLQIPCKFIKLKDYSSIRNKEINKVRKCVITKIKNRFTASCRLKLKCIVLFKFF